MSPNRGAPGPSLAALKTGDVSALGAGLPVSAFGGNLDMKVSQLAERVSILLAGVQTQCASGKQDLERQLDSLTSRVENRLASIDMRLSAVEDKRDRSHAQERMENVAVTDPSRIMSEVRALLDGALEEVQSQWRGKQNDILDGQQDQARQLEELSEHTKRGAARMQEAEVAFEGLQQGLDLQAENLQQVSNTLRSFVSGGNATPWYGELEACVARLEHRIEEHRAAAEHQLNRFRGDSEGLRLRLEGLKEDALCAVDRRIDQEIDRLQTQRVDRYDEQRSGKDAQRRLDEFEARIAAMRVRIDAHDDRFGALGERAEATCAQALEGARQAASQYKEEILNEVECELGILRQRMEAVGEICEELSVNQAYGPPR